MVLLPAGARAAATLPSVHCKMNSSWHSRFNPQQFLRGVNLERLLRRNEVFEGNGLVAGTAPCVICGNVGGSVLVLNDRRVVCKSCFERLSLIQYPEVYETAWRDYRRISEARSLARARLVQQSGSRRLSSVAGTIGFLSLFLLLWKPVLFAVSAACFVISFFPTRLTKQASPNGDHSLPRTSRA